MECKGQPAESQKVSPHSSQRNIKSKISRLTAAKGLSPGGAFPKLGGGEPLGQTNKESNAEDVLGRQNLSCSVRLPDVQTGTDNTQSLIKWNIREGNRRNEVAFVKFRRAELK